MGARVRDADARAIAPAGRGWLLVDERFAGPHHQQQPLDGRAVARARARRVTDRRGCLRPRADPAPGTDLADQDQRNAWWYSIDRERPLDETLIAAPLWAAALVEAIAAVPDAEFARGYTFGDHLHIAQVRPIAEGEPSWSLESIIASFADEHYHGHNADIQAAHERGHYGGQN